MRTRSQEWGLDQMAGVVRTMPSVVLLCIALFVNFLVVGGHDPQRVVGIATMMSGAVLLLSRLNAAGSATLCAGRADQLLALFFALGVLASVTAYAPRIALFEVSSLFLLYLLACAVASDIAHRGGATINLVLKAVAVIALLRIVNFAAAYMTALGMHIAPDMTDLTSGFGNIRAFNHAQTPTLPLLILISTLTPRAAKSRWLWLSAAAYWWMVLFATSGRGTLIGTMAACAAVALVSRRAAFPYLRQAALTATGGIAAYFVVLVAIPILCGGEGMSALSDAVLRSASDPTSHRTVLWGRAWSLIAQHPLLGIGPMHFAHFGQDIYIGAHPHDWILQIGSEWGLPALVCLVGAIALGLRALWHAGHMIAADDRRNQAIQSALLVGALAILVDGLVSGLFVMPQSQLAVALYLGCAMGWYRTVVPVKAHQPGTPARATVGVLIVAAMAGIGSVAPEIPARLENRPLTAEQRAANPGTYWPRLWGAGYF